MIKMKGGPDYKADEENAQQRRAIRDARLLESFKTYESMSVEMNNLEIRQQYPDIYRDAKQYIANNKKSNNGDDNMRTQNQQVDQWGRPVQQQQQQPQQQPQLDQWGRPVQAQQQPQQQSQLVQWGRPAQQPQPQQLDQWGRPVTLPSPQQLDQWGRPVQQPEQQQQLDQWGRPVPARQPQQLDQWGRPVPPPPPQQSQLDQWGRPVMPTPQQLDQWGRPVMPPQQLDQWGRPLQQPMPNRNLAAQAGTIDNAFSNVHRQPTPPPVSNRANVDAMRDQRFSKNDDRSSRAPVQRMPESKPRSAPKPTPAPAQHIPTVEEQSVPMYPGQEELCINTFDPEFRDEIHFDIEDHPAMPKEPKATKPTVTKEVPSNPLNPKNRSWFIEGFTKDQRPAIIPEEYTEMERRKHKITKFDGALVIDLDKEYAKGYDAVAEYAAETAELLRIKNMPADPEGTITPLEDKSMMLLETDTISLKTSSDLGRLTEQKDHINDIGITSTSSIVAMPLYTNVDLTDDVAKLTSSRSFYDLALNLNALVGRESNIAVKRDEISVAVAINDRFTNMINDFMNINLQSTVSIDDFSTDVLELSMYIKNNVGPDALAAFKRFENESIKTLNSEIGKDSLEDLKETLTIPEGVHVSFVPFIETVSHVDIGLCSLGQVNEGDAVEIDVSTNEYMKEIISVMKTRKQALNIAASNDYITTVNGPMYKITPNALDNNVYYVELLKLV